MRYQALVQPPRSRRIVRVTCDICGEEIKTGRGWDATDVNIDASIGDVFPECDCREVYEIDCCSRCFLEGVRPTLERELGVKFRERRSDDYESEEYAVQVESKP